MSEQYVQLTIEGVDAANAQFLRIQSVAGSIGKTVAQAARAAEDRIRQTFRDRASPWGVPWQGLSPVTISLRQARDNFSIQQLIDSGAMYDTLHVTEEGNSATVSVGNPESWPDVHQFGNPNNKAWGRGHAPIPARPFFPLRPDGQVELPDTWLAGITKPMDDALREAAK